MHQEPWGDGRISYFSDVGDMLRFYPACYSRFAACGSSQSTSLLPPVPWKTATLLSQLSLFFFNLDLLSAFQKRRLLFWQAGADAHIFLSFCIKGADGETDSCTDELPKNGPKTLPGQKVAIETWYKYPKPVSSWLLVLTQRLLGFHSETTSLRGQ